MLKKSKRLSTKQFNEVILKGRVYHSSLFMLRALDGKMDEKISAVAPTKIFKKAIERNKVRRKIYKALQDLLKTCKLNSHVIVFAKKGVLQAKTEDISNDLKLVFVKAGILM